MEQGTIRAGGLGTVLFVELSVSLGTPWVTCWDHALGGGEEDREVKGIKEDTLPP